MRIKKRRFAIVAALTVALLSPITASAESATNPSASTSAERGAAGEAQKQKVGDVPADFDALPSTALAAPKSNCAETKRNLDSLRKAGQKKAVCFEWQTPQEQAKNRGVSAEPSANAVWCSQQPQNTTYVERTGICSVRDVIIIVMDTVTGMIYGKAYGTVEQEIDTQNSIPEFFEYMNFYLYNSDVTSSAMTISVTPVCSLDTSCKQNAGAHPGWESKGQPLHREANEAEARKNRDVVCDSTFTPASSTPEPQCDEFPFANNG